MQHSLLLITDFILPQFVRFLLLILDFQKQQVVFVVVVSVQVVIAADCCEMQRLPSICATVTLTLTSDLR